MRNRLKESLISLLKDMGIISGGTVFVQSDLRFFMDAARSIAVKDLPKFLLDCLLEAVGSSGTIVMPGFTTDCARKGMPFDLCHTPSDSGALVEQLRCQPQTRRSLHPVNSVIAFGARAESLTKDVSLGNYSWDSPFDRMASGEATILCMGMRANLSNSFSHYAETRSNLPYMYNKFLDYIAVSVDGVPVRKPFYMTVRYLDFDVVPDRVKHDQVMRESGLMQFGKWGGGTIRAISLKKYLNVLMPELRNDPFFLLSHPPAFRKGECPADGKSENQGKDKKGAFHERI